MSAASAYVYLGAKNNYSLRLTPNDDANWVMQVNTTGGLNMSDGGSYNGTWNPASSKKLKENIKNLTGDEAVDALKALNPVKFNYIEYKDEDRVGFIAEDVPELVAMNGRKNLGTVDILAVLTKVVQEQQKVDQEYRETMGHLWTGFSEERMHSWMADAGFDTYYHRSVPPDPDATGPLLFVGNAFRR